MPTYEVQAPDGNLLEFEGPEGASQDELLAYAQKMYQPKQSAEDVGFIPGSVAAAKRGVESLGDVASGLGLAGTALTGTEAETRAKMQAIKAQQAIPETTPGMTAEGIQKLYQEKGLGAAAAQVPKYISENILQSAPQMAIPLAAGAAASPFLTPVGGALVGMGTYGIQQFGNFLVRQAQEKNDPKELDIAKAATTAAITAPLGYYADRFTAGLGGLGERAGAEIVKELTARQIAAQVGKRVAVGATEGVIAEAPVEVLEQAAERYQAGLDLTSDDAKREFKEAFFGAAAAGGGIGGISRGFQGKAKPAVTPEVAPEAPTTPEAAGVTSVPPSSSIDTEAMMAELEGREPRTTALTETPSVTEAAPVTEPVVKTPQSEALVDATTIPTPEINEAAAGQNNFAFIDKGEVKSIYGQVIKKDGKNYVQYRNEQNQPRQRLLTNNIMVNPTPDHMELLRLYKDKETTEGVKDNLLAWLKKYGVHPQEKADMGLEKAIKKGIPVGIFRKDGYGLDELATAAVNDGILTEQDLQDGVGGVESMRNLVNAALSGDVAATPFNMKQQADLYGINKRIQELETKLEPAPEEAVAQQAQESEAEKESAAQFAANYREGTVEEQEMANRHAEKTAGHVVYQKGPYALIRGYNLFGDVVYAPTNGGTRHLTDVSKVKDNFIPSTELKEMLSIKDKLEKQTVEDHKTNPFIKFNKAGLSFSEHVTPKLRGVITEWKKLINLKQDIYISTLEDARSDALKFTGPHRVIGSAVLSTTAAGSTRQMQDGSRYIVLKTNVSPTELLETLAHEMGHAHQREVFEKAPKELQAKIRAEHDKWLASQKGKSAKELVDSMRARKSAKTTRFSNPMMDSAKMTSYWKSFSEWYADQVSRWATTSDKPVTAVEKFFAKLGAAIKRFFLQAKNKKYLPNETFKQYLDGMATEAQVDLIADKLYKGQMALFSERAAPEQPYVTVDEIYKMQRDAYNEFAKTPEFKASQKRIDDARNEYIDRFNAVKAEAVRLLTINPEFSKLAIALDEKKILERVAMDAFQKQAEENVPLPKISEGQMIAEQNKLIQNYFDSKGIPEPREFSEFANQNRAYYSDPRFRRWFGDSKVVDKNGQPLVAFHSTDKDFSEFNVGKGAPLRTKNLDYTGQLGSWFTAPSLYDREYETGNAENAVTFSEGNEGDNIMPVHLSIKNPMEYEGFEDLREDRDSYKSINEYKKALIDQGYDGVVVRNSMTDGNVDRDDWVAFKPTQIKSAIGNTGEFNPEDADIRYSERVVSEEPTPKVNKHRNIDGQIVSPVWNSPEVSKIDNFLYKLQDKHIDTKRVMQAITKAAGQLDDNWNVYLKEELYHGRTSAALRKFLLQDLMPAIKQMSKMGISPDDMKAYLYNRHAAERNDQIAKIRPATLPDGSPNPNAMTDKGSGLSYKQIDDYFSKLDPAKAKKLNEVAKEFDKMIKGTQDILVKSGAETQSTIDAWNNTYDNYVPLFRADDDFASHPSQGTGAGFSSSGASSKRAIGSEKEVQDILGNIIAQRERALIKSEKIRVGRALYGLAIKSPNPNFWLPVNPDAIKDPTMLAHELDSLGLDGQDAVGMMQEMKKPEIVKDSQTGLDTVRYKINPLERYKENVFPVRVNGKDRYIFFNQNDPRAKRMVESMKSLDTEQLGEALGMIGKLTRWFSAVNTQYNPVFGGINLLRDVQGAMFNLSTTKIAGEQKAVTAGVFPAMRGIFATLKAERNGQPIPDTAMAKLWDEFKSAGGQTLYRDSLTRKTEEKQLVEHELDRMKRGPAKRAFSRAVEMLSDFNDTIENSVRLSAYKVAKDKGLSVDQAASIAKNLTVNFDRKGQLGSRINALYAFFNASMQGTARLAETLKGPAGRKIVAGGIALGAMQAVLLAAAGFEDDEPPEFIKERNLIIPLPGGKYAMIPMPLGLHFFPNIGRKTTEFVLGGGKDPGKHTADLFRTAMDAFNPVGSSGLSMQTLLPTVADPLAALEANKDAFGRPIYKADRATNPTPGYTRSRESASEISKLLSEFLNYASGGTEFKKGAISPTADAIDYLAGQFTGGAGREVMKVEQAVKAAATGEELPAYRVPLAGRFVGDIESKAADAQRFYDNVTKMAEHENEIKGRRKPGYTGSTIAEYMGENPEARLWQQANNAENQISQLNKQKKDWQQRKFPPEKIQTLEEKKQVIMQRFNKQVKAIQE